MARKKQSSSRTQPSQSNKGSREVGMDVSPQGQRPEDVGEDLPEPSRKPSESDEDRGKKDTGKQPDEQRRQ